MNGEFLIRRPAALDWMLVLVEEPITQGIAMSQTTPPEPPVMKVRDEPPMRRVQVRLLQIALASATIFAAAWCYQIHIALGLTATFLAKHILVAILAAGLRLPMRDVKS